jgi:hypothetical protein
MSVTPPAGHDAAVRQEALETDGTFPSDLSEKTIGEEDPEQAPQVETKAVDVQPDGGYGWVVVACCFLINGTYSINLARGLSVDDSNEPQDILGELTAATACFSPIILLQIHIQAQHLWNMLSLEVFRSLCVKPFRLSQQCVHANMVHE